LESAMPADSGWSPQLDSAMQHQNGQKRFPVSETLFNQLILLGFFSIAPH
jgi:hypothetical protein